MNPAGGRRLYNSLNTPLDPTNGNRYAYTGDNPTNSIDPNGLSALGCVAASSLGVAAVISTDGLALGLSALGGTAAVADQCGEYVSLPPTVTVDPQQQNNPSGGPSNQTPGYSADNPDTLAGPGNFR